MLACGHSRQSESITIYIISQLFIRRRKKTPRSFFCKCHSLLKRAIAKWTKGMSQNRFDSAYLDNLVFQFQSIALPVLEAGTASWQCAPLCPGWHVIRSRAVWARFKCATLSFKAVYGIAISPQSVPVTCGWFISTFVAFLHRTEKALRLISTKGPAFKHQWPGWLVWSPSSWPTSGATQCRVGSRFGAPWQKMSEVRFWSWLLHIRCP